MKKAVMYGAGNIGRGFIGQLFSLSGYEVVFLDISEAVIGRLNADRQYPLRLVSAAGCEETVVRNVRGVNSLFEDSAAREIATADIMATAVGANVLPRIAPVIVKGLELRWREYGAAPLNILICENLMNANKVLEDLLLKNLDASLHERIRNCVGLVEASIGRMVPAATEEMQEGNILRTWAEPYCELPVDLSGFKGKLPNIVGMKAFSPFEFYIKRKLYMHNMSHAVLAYLGWLGGYQFIWQAVRDRAIASCTRGALMEAALALSRRHGAPLSELTAYFEDLMARFNNELLGDTTERVGRDPVRKLAPGDRLAGALCLCQEQGVVPEHIAVGVAAAMLFRPEADEAAMRIQKDLNERGLPWTLSACCGIDGSNPVYPMLVDYYKRFSQEKKEQSGLG